jgi:hypothetical protein
MAGDRNHCVWKGMGVGLMGGLVGSWTMNQFPAMWSKLSPAGEHRPRQAQRQQPEEQEPATVKLAEKIGATVLHRNLKPDEKKIAEPLVHYGYGTFMGGVYGALGEVTPVSTKAVGLPFGAAALFARLRMLRKLKEFFALRVPGRANRLAHGR